MGAHEKLSSFFFHNMKVAAFTFTVSSWNRICNTAPHRTCDCRRHAGVPGGTSQRSPDKASPLKGKEEKLHHARESAVLYPGLPS